MCCVSVCKHYLIHSNLDPTAFCPLWFNVLKTISKSNFPCLFPYMLLKHGGGRGAVNSL